MSDQLARGRRIPRVEVSAGVIEGGDFEKYGENKMSE